MDLTTVSGSVPSFQDGQWSTRLNFDRLCRSAEPIETCEVDNAKKLTQRHGIRQGVSGALTDLT